MAIICNEGVTCPVILACNPVSKIFGRALTQAGAQRQPGQVDAGLGFIFVLSFFACVPQ